MKNKKADINWFTLLLIASVIAIVVLIFLMTDTFSSASNEISSVELQREDLACDAYRATVEVSTDNPNDERLKDTDGDGKVDNCDKCLGLTDPTLGGKEGDGDNSKDSDADYLPDDCDATNNDVDKPNFKQYRLYDIEAEEYLNQFCTESYAIYYNSQQANEEGLHTQSNLICKQVN